MIRVSTLGQVSICSDNGDSTVESLLDHPKRLALFLVLASEPGHDYQRDSLTALFWPDRDDHHARNSLRQAIHVLRTVAGMDAIVTRGGGAVGVDPELVTSDAAEFSCGVAKGNLEEALELYQGDFLEGFYVPGEPAFERWVDNRRAGLRRLAFDTAEALARRFEGKRDRRLTLKFYRRALELAPFNESIARRLIWFMAQLGNHSEALAEYLGLENRLHSELGVSPSPATRQLVRESLGVNPDDNRGLRGRGSAQAGPGPNLETSDRC